MWTLPFRNISLPLYIQIYEYIKNLIRKGNLLAFERLPSKRKLATYLGVSVNTIDLAYSQLVSEGYIEALPKKGYFVCEIDEYLQQHIIKQQKKQDKTNENIIIDFSPSNIEKDMFPFETFKKMFKNSFNEYDKTLLKKPHQQGDISLRQALVKFLFSSRGVSCTENQIIIGNGTDSLLLILSLIFGKDMPIVLENPVYLKAYKIFENIGNKVYSVDIDEKGIDVNKLKEFSELAVYVTPSHHFPLGFSMPIDRRIKLLNFVNEMENRYIIEDDYDSEFRYNRKPIPSLKSIDISNKVIYIGTFSKSIAPSFRISYMVLPQPLLDLYIERYQEISPIISSLEQKMIANFINEGYFEKHLNKMRKIYRDKRQLLIENLAIFGENIEIIGENAGHHLLVKLKTNMTELEMCKTALTQGVKVYSVSQYFIGEVPKKYNSSVLLGYSSLTNKEIEQGVLLLKDVWLKKL